MTYPWGAEVEALIRELYGRQNKTLRDVMAIVNKEFPDMNGAKERTYQKYLKKWGIAKVTSRRARQEPSRTCSNQRTLRSTTRRPRLMCQTSLDTIDLSENTSSNEGSVASSVGPVGYNCDPVVVEPTAQILSTLSSHDHRSAEPTFVSAISSTTCPEYPMEDSFFQSQATGEGSRVSNNMSGCEITDISVYTNSDIALDMNLTSDPMSHMVKDDGNRPGLSPLAQQAVKAYLMIHSMSLADYRKLYAQTGRKLAQDSEHGTDETEYAEIIPFEISLQALSVEDDKLLLFCSFMGSSNIALDILSHFLKSPQERINSSIVKLSHYGLVSQNHRSKRISIEATIHNWLWVRNRLPRRLPLVQRMMVQVGDSIFLGHTPSKEDWEFARLSIPYLGALAETILRYKDSGGSIWHKKSLNAAVVIADAARRVGANEQSRRILGNVFPILKDILGNQDSLTLQAMNALSVVFINMKDLRSAESLLRKLIRIQEQISDIKGCSYVTQLSNWARVLVKLGLDDDAHEALDRIAELGKRVEDPMEILIHNVKLAETQRFCGNLKEAEGLLLRVLKDSEIMLRRDHLKTIRVLELLCYVYSDQKNWAQAELNSSKLVTLSQQALGPLQPDTVRRVKFHEKMSRRRGKQRE